MTRADQQLDAARADLEKVCLSMCVVLFGVVLCGVVLLLCGAVLCGAVWSGFAVLWLGGNKD